jgi:peroxiredoxin Q/BCP
MSSLEEHMRNMWVLVFAVAVFAFAAVPWAADLKVGDPAPDFTLQASDGKTYKLSDFKGRQAVVVAWFPKAYTRGCTIECKSLAEHGDLIKKFNTTYFMASVDTLEDNKGFAEQQKADFPLLSDPTKKTAEAYGVLNQNGLASRWTFYIGADGKILAIDKEIKPATSAEDMAAKLAELGVAKR